MTEVRKLDDRDNTVELIRYVARELSYLDYHNYGARITETIGNDVYLRIADHAASVAGELLALANHLRSKLEPEKPVVKPRTRKTS